MKIILDADLKGGWPINLDRVAGDLGDWYPKACELLRAGRTEEALDLVRPHLRAEFSDMDMPKGLGTDQVEGLTALPDGPKVTVRGIRIEDDPSSVSSLTNGDVPVIAFQWWSAAFEVDVSEAILRAWTESDVDGHLVFSEDACVEWADENDLFGLYDGNRWYLGPIRYDLEGMGHHSCRVRPGERADVVLQALSKGGS